MRWFVTAVALCSVGGPLPAFAGGASSQQGAVGRLEVLGLKAAEPRYCPGEYADDLSALNPKARAFEQEPHGPYTYCVRNVATYECVSYGADGTLKKQRRRTVSHGTAFAYRQQNGDTYLLTNQHVAEWPAVTDEEHTAGDVPQGCKRVSETLKIVDNDGDAYDRDDIPLQEVVADPALDMAVLKAPKQLLPVVPWKIGRSAALRERNAVDVRGFPLGAFKATNVGKVISAYDHDDYKDWDHDDFVIDALLSPGNSGSPVFAVSCRTGEFELVGVYHAGYTGGSALNVVVGIDQVRDLMTTLKRSPRASDSSAALDPADRAKLMVQPPNTEPFFSFGGLPAVVYPRPDGALVFEVMGRDFPLKSYPIFVAEDLAADDHQGFGVLGRVWFGGRQGIKGYSKSELDAEAQSQVQHVIDALRRDAVAAQAYRTVSKGSTGSREEFDAVSRLERALRKNASTHSDLSGSLQDLADRLAPKLGESASPVAEAFRPASPAALAGSEELTPPAQAPVPAASTTEARAQ